MFDLLVVAFWFKTELLVQLLIGIIMQVPYTLFQIHFTEVYFTYDKVYILEMGTVRRVLTNVYTHLRTIKIKIENIFIINLL